jgi:hypothetical protein
MTPTNLPDLYARVVAKRPELAVKELEYRVGYWQLDDNDYNSFLIDPHTAASLILAKWVEMLPVNYVLARHTDGWEVAENFYNDVQWSPKDPHPIPLEALASYWLEAP